MGLSLLERPKNSVVARFVQAGNLLVVRVSNEGQWLRLIRPDGLEFRAPRAAGQSFAENEEVLLMVRPENVYLSSGQFEGVPPGSTLLEGTIQRMADVGAVVQDTVACWPRTELLVSLGRKEYNSRRLNIGDRVNLAVAPEDVHVLEE